MQALKIVIYRLLDLLIFRKGVRRNIGGFFIYFPSRWARYFDHLYEKENIAFLKKACKPGMTVIDVGAHLGLMSVISAQLVGKTGKVFAFEPTPFTFSVLHEVLNLNQASHAVAINKAVARQNGKLNFYISADDGSNSNSLVSKNQRNRKAVEIPVVSIDSFVEEKELTKTDLIKIDAEGTEYDVLRGAQNTISRNKPVIILAVHPALISNHNQSIDDIYEFIEKNNYTVLFNNKPLDKENFCNMTDFFDVHLIPAS